MRRACLVAVCALILLLWGARPLRAEEPWIPRAVTVSPPGEALRNPALAVRPDGQAVLALLARGADNGAPRAYLALSPSWRFAPIDQAGTAGAADELLLRADGVLSAAWSAMGADGRILVRARALARQQMQLGEPQIIEPEAPESATYALGPDGSLAAVWTDGTMLYVWREGIPAPLTVPFPASRTASGVQFFIDGQGALHIAFEGRDEARATSGVYYLQLTDDASAAVLTEVAPQGTAPLLAVGPEGRAHLAWWQADTLYYANGPAWQARVAIPADISRPQVVALAAGPDGSAYLVWLQGQELNWANVLDLERTRVTYPLVGQMTGLSAAVDGRGRLHMAWASRDGANLQYLAAWVDAPQIAVTYPLADDLLKADTRAIAQTNLPLGEVERVEFYLEPWDDSPSAGVSALLSLGVDSVPADGWSAPLPLAGLQDGQRYRVSAWAVRRTGELMRATGGWFRAQPLGAPALWPGETSELAGSPTTLWIAPPPERSAPLAADVFLRPVLSSSCSELAGCVAAPGAALQHVQSVTLDTGRAESVAFDADSWQPGTYQALLRWTDGMGVARWAAAQHPLVMEGVPGLRVQVTTPARPVVAGRRLELAADVTDMQRAIVRVDFWLSRASALDGSQEPAPPDLFWAGSDDEGEDGWTLRVAVDPFWLGGTWYAWAAAHDDAGNSASARSAEPFYVLGERSAVTLQAPTVGEPLSGVQEFLVDALPGQPGVTGITAYLMDDEAHITPVGTLVSVEGIWRLAWDTGAVADGAYRVLLVVSLADAHRGLVVSDVVRVANAAAGYRFVSPTAPGPWKGQAWLTVQGPEEMARGLARFYVQDAGGLLLPVADGAPQGAQWVALWNTRAVLDGDYTLVALAPGANGRWVRLEQPAQVRNTSPQLTLVGERAVWNGLERVAWQAEHPVGQPITVTVEYSPDEGGHWLYLDQVSPGQDAILWDTRDVPDTAQGLLRLTGCDTVRCTRTSSGPVAVRNHNRAPELVLLAPDELAPRLGREVRIAWQAADPEGGPVTVTVSYRPPDGEWQLLAKEQPATGTFVWDTRALPTGEGYALRIEALDDAGAHTARQLAERILTGQSAPTVHLVWPNGNLHLDDEVAILWHAIDRDGDRLMVDLYYSDNNGQAWLPLAEGLENTGYYVWQVAFLPPGVQYRLRAVARDGLFQAVAESEGSFVVGDEGDLQVALLSPRAQDAVAGWQLVRWEVTDPEHRALVADVGVRAVGEAVWRPIAVGVPSDGFWLWDASALPEGDYVLRVTVADERTSVMANANVTLHVANDPHPAPSARLLQPLGGERWDGLRTVLWEVGGVAGPLTATLSLSLDSGLTWRELAQVDARSGGYLWDTRTVAPSRRCLLRLSVSNGEVTGFDQTEGLFALVNRASLPPYIGLLQLQESGVGSDAVVRWLAEDSDGDTLRMDLATSSDHGVTWQELASGIADVGELVLSGELVAGAQVLRLIASDGLYRVQASQPVETSSSSVASPPQLQFSAPSAGETWAGQAIVRWQASDPLGQSLAIALAWSADGGLTWSNLARSLPNSGGLPWDTTAVPNGAYLLRLTASNGLRTRTVLSESVMIRNVGHDAPAIALLTPAKHQVWAGLQEVRWRTSDADQDRLLIGLEYSLDRGRSWESLAASLPDTGSYVWDTALSPNCREVWLAATVSDGQFIARRVAAASVEVRNLLAPQVHLLVDPHTGPLQGVRRIGWRADYAGSRRVQVTLELSSDGGRSWKVLARDLGARGSIIWDTRTIPDGSAVLLRATASDGVAKGVELLWEPLVILGNISQSSTQPWYPR